MGHRLSNPLPKPLCAQPIDTPTAPSLLSRQHFERVTKFRTDRLGRRSTDDAARGNCRAHHRNQHTLVGTPWRNLTYVQVHTDEGITGVGETRMLGHTDALIGYLREAEANHILGSDPFAVEDLVRRMKYGDYGRAGEIVMSGIAVVEMACWDIKGKALGVPVWQLLGGKVTDRVKAYANGWYTTERTPDAYHKPPRRSSPAATRL